MVQRDLEHLNLCPFSNHVRNDSLNRRLTEGEEMTRLVLLFRYLTLLCQQCQIVFSIPQMTVYLEKNVCYTNVLHYSYFKEKRKKLLEELQKDILLNSGWSYGTAKLCGEKISDIRIYSKTDIKKKDWHEKISKIPSIRKLEKKRFHDLHITVCWNERVAKYLNYIADHSEEKDNLFLEEADLIDNILKKMENPYSMNFTFSRCSKDNYIMGLFDGKNEEGEELIWNIHYDFFVQAVILHVLLTQAEEVFGL